MRRVVCGMWRVGCGVWRVGERRGGGGAYGRRSPVDPDGVATEHLYNNAVFL